MFDRQILLTTDLEDWNLGEMLKNRNICQSVCFQYTTCNVKHKELYEVDINLKNMQFVTS